MNKYLDSLYGRRERYVDTVKRKKAKAPVQKVPDKISEEEVFVEYDDSSPSFRAWLSGIFSSKKSRIPLDDDDVPVEQLPSRVRKELEAEEAELEKVDAEVEVLEERRESLITRFLATLRGARRVREADDVLEDVPMLDEEVKEVLKRLHKWLEKLPNREMREFKVSDDFELYKQLLGKYGLIKK